MPSVYWIVPAGGKVYAMFAPVVLILLGVLWLMSKTAVGAQRARFELNDTHLRVRGDLYGRAIPYERLRIDQARVVDLRGEPNLQPTSRRMGTGMPGYSAGWFRLRNGSKALVYVTDRTSVVYIPTTYDYVLLLSAQRAEEMIEELRRRAA